MEFEAKKVSKEARDAFHPSGVILDGGTVVAVLSLIRHPIGYLVAGHAGVPCSLLQVPSAAPVSIGCASFFLSDGTSEDFPSVRRERADSSEEPRPPRKAQPQEL